MNFNPNALALWAFCAIVGLLLGSWAIGLAVGLGISILATVTTDRRPIARRRRRPRR